MSSQNVIPENELPNWMKQARRDFDWGIVIVVGFCLLIAWPFIENPDLPRTNNNIHYAFQTADTAESLREGRLYPRWSPHAFGGYGAPIPNYTPPLPAYVTATTEVLFTNNTLLAMRIVYIMTFIIAGLAMYALVTQQVNAIAGLFAAILYVCSPYISLTVPRVLGDLPQAIALALIPALLWAVNRLLTRNQPVDVFYIAVMSAALFLTAPKYAIAGLGLSVLLLVIHFIEFRSLEHIQAVASASFIGFGMAAFFWIPAFYERDLVQWLPVSLYPPQYRLQLSEFFVRTHQLDPSALRSIPVFNLGWALILFVIVSSVLLILQKGSRFQFIYLLTGIVIGTAAGIVASETWLIGCIIICLVLGSSALGQRLYTMRRLLRYPLMIVLLATICWGALPAWLSVSSSATIGNINASEQIKYENLANTVAVLPADAVFPLTMPYETIQSNIFNADITYTPGQNQFRSNNSVQAAVSQQGTQFARYTVFSQSQTWVTYEQAYFPGWRAILDNEPIPLLPIPQSGLTQIRLPETSNSTLTVSLGTVPIRATAWLLSYIMLGTILIHVWRRWRKHAETFDQSHLLPKSDVRLLGIILIVVFAGSLSAPIQNQRKQADYLLRNRVFASNATASHLEFQGYGKFPQAYHAGETIDLSLYWKVVYTSPDTYLASVAIRQVENNTIIVASEKHPPGFYPTALWATNLYIEDQYRLQLPDTLEAGSYVLDVHLWRCTETCDEPVTFYRPDRQVLGETLSISIPIQTQ